MSYPTKVEIKGEIYPINSGYKDALRCIEVVYDNTIGDSERALAILKILYGEIPTHDLDLFLEKAIKFLSCGRDEKDDDVDTYFDHNYDFEYVTASFYSDYHIDLAKENLHWWRYCELLGGLTKNSILSRVIEIRQYDMRDVKDPKIRADIIKAKENVQLPIHETREEREAREKFEALLKGV